MKVYISCLSSVEWEPKSRVIHFDREQPERIPSITWNVKSLLTSSGSLHAADGHNDGYPTPLKQEKYTKI